MISLQKAMRLGIAPETASGNKKIEIIHIREDCNPETISDMLRLYGEVAISKPLSNEDFDNVLQKIYKKNNFSNFDEVLSLERAIPIEEAKHNLLSATSIESKENDAPAIQLLNSILAQSLAKNASDIHFEPNDETFDIKMRIDGNIITLLSLQLDVAPRLISRIKILGKINISERRLPQDGRVSFSMGSQIIDVRISTLPTGSGSGSGSDFFLICSFGVGLGGETPSGLELSLIDNDFDFSKSGDSLSKLPKLSTSGDSLSRLPKGLSSFSGISWSTTSSLGNLGDFWGDGDWETSGDEFKNSSKTDSRSDTELLLDGVFDFLSKSLIDIALGDPCELSTDELSNDCNSLVLLESLDFSDCSLELSKNTNSSYPVGWYNGCSFDILLIYY